jgi:hypothetical protein
MFEEGSLHGWLDIKAGDVLDDWMVKISPIFDIKHV